MNKIIALIALLLTFTSNGQLIKRSKYKHELNTTLVSEIGDEMFSKGEEYYRHALKIIDIPKFRINMVRFPYKVGDYLFYYKDYENYKLYTNPKFDDYLSIGSVGIAFDKKKNRYIAYMHSFEDFLTKKLEGALIVEETIYIEPNCFDCLEKVFIYNGRVGNVVKFTYREFVDDRARPSFTQDVQYDLSNSDIVGFKGLRIQILNADNSTIEYKVLEDFN